MTKTSKILLLGSAIALTTTQIGFEESANAQFKLKDMFEEKDGKLNINLGKLLVGLLFGSKKDATQSDSCQLDVDAQSLVDKDIYGNRYQTGESQKLYCNNFKIKGLKGDENRQFAEQYLAVRQSSLEASGSGVAKIVDKKGRSKDVPFSWQDGGEVETTETLTVIDGVKVPENVVASSPSRSFRTITVRKGSHLNLRSGAGINHSITGIYKGGNIVLVKAFFVFAPDKKCKSGRWALLQNNGTGNGFVCANYLGDAPASTSIADVDSFQKPPKIFVTPKTGYTQNKSFRTKRTQTTLAANVGKKTVNKTITSTSTGLQGLKGTGRTRG